MTQEAHVEYGELHDLIGVISTDCIVYKRKVRNESFIKHLLFPPSTIVT